MQRSPTYQRQQGILDADQSLPLDYMTCFNNAPNRWAWRNSIRSSGHYPLEFVTHADKVVATYDRIEARMAEDEDAEFSDLYVKYFGIEAPPPPSQPM